MSLWLSVKQFFYEFCLNILHNSIFSLIFPVSRLRFPRLHKILAFITVKKDPNIQARPEDNLNFKSELKYCDGNYQLSTVSQEVLLAGQRTVKQSRAGESF